MNIKKGDKVIVLSGKNKGKKGKVLEVFPKDGKLIVERVNVVKRHQKPSQQFQGGVIEKAMPLPVSKVMVVCNRCDKPARIKAKLVEDKRVRACAKCGEVLDKVK